MTEPLPSSRIKEIPPNELSLEQQAAIEAVVGGRGRIPTPYKIWLHSPLLMQRLERLGTFLVNESSLTSREQEIAILIIARHWHGDYVFTAHARAAKKAGISPAVIAAIERGDVPELSDARERAVVALAQAVQNVEPADDATFEFALSALGQAGVAELLAFLGYYSAVAMAMKTFRVPVPTER